MLMIAHLDSSVGQDWNIFMLYRLVLARSTSKLFVIIVGL